MHDIEHSSASHHHHEHPEHADGKARDAALLSYMVAHNKSHADELRELASHIDAPAARCVNEAVELFDRGNALLEQALESLGEE